MFYFSAGFSGDTNAARRAVEEYREILLQHGFRQAGQYRVRTDDLLKWWDNQVKQEQKNILKNLVS